MQGNTLIYPGILRRDLSCKTKKNECKYCVLLCRFSLCDCKNLKVTVYNILEEYMEVNIKDVNVRGPCLILERSNINISKYLSKSLNV